MRGSERNETVREDEREKRGGGCDTWKVVLRSVAITNEFANGERRRCEEPTRGGIRCKAQEMQPRTCSGGR